MSNSGNENESDNETTTVDNTDPDEGRPSSPESSSDDLLQVSINFDNLCSICLNEVSVTSYADGCLHKFCGRCIFEWARRSQLCPICRTFFANIITNVLSDTDYEVIPLEERRASVFNFIRDSWWTNNNRNQPSNRNIFAVRQFSRQPHNQRNQQPHPQMVQQPQTAYQEEQQEPQPRGQQSQPEMELTPVIRGMDNLYIENRRPRRPSACAPSPVAHPRIIWASNRYNRNPNRPPNNRQAPRHRSNPPSTSSPPPPPPPAHQSRGNSTHSYPTSRAPFPAPNPHLTSQTGSTFQNNNNNNAHHRRNQGQSNRSYNDRGHYRMVQSAYVPYVQQNYNNHNFNNNINYHRSRSIPNNIHSFPQRPLRPLVGVRQENISSSSSTTLNNNQNNTRPNHRFNNDEMN
ncbi:myb-like protein B [Tetranychus urticae]|uniref:RING-type E3 ubiquitin transferase n=1 Tax=Tetranychus urticae TaxID=32264 RepID=T1K9S6_TETUR|nr:myb-like protein B [Tetranychus urticae]